LIICDTSGLYAAYNSGQPGHRETVAAVNGSSGLLVVSHYVVTELDYLLRTKVGVNAEIGMLRDVEAGAYDVTALSETELGKAISLIEQYADRNLGIADAANVVLAARHRTTNLLTLDERDYRIVRPLWGNAFTLLPADARSTT
jgi:predicted nucleic acid-binding protein